MSDNLKATGKTFRILSEFSVPALIKLCVQEMSSPTPGFDWLYIDGSHEADDTLLDGELAWRLAKKDAIFIFDDYRWNREPEESAHHPRRGIDAFLDLHRGEYQQLSGESQYQVVLKKSSDMRIGFLVPDKVDRGLDLAEAFGYGINVALAIDAAYAMPAAVTLHSLVDNTSGRISIYIVDCGLSSEDKDRLEGSIPTDRRRGDVTLMFVVSKGMGGATWAKLDIHNVVPAQRVLYLDADTLVRSSLKVLWNTDLRGKAIAAVPDVGHPMGHDNIRRAPYFNAGVLLMDLAKVRSRSNGLGDLARTMESARYQEQDVLNVHFADDWISLHLKWNAQGLGTYAMYPAAEKTHLDLKEMDEPSIVHFTGRVHPRMGDVLNPYVQPPTSKPWGYAGAPGHPYEREWWSVLERTRWNDELLRDAWKKDCQAAKMEAIQEGILGFHERVAAHTNTMRGL